MGPVGTMSKLALLTKILFLYAYDVRAVLIRSIRVDLSIALIIFMVELCCWLVVSFYVFLLVCYHVLQAFISVLLVDISFY